MTRDEVLKEFAIRADALPWGFDMAQRRVNLLADEVVRLRSILAALREPSETVLQAAGHEVLRYVDPNEGDMRSAIIAAVAAAEREVGA